MSAPTASHGGTLPASRWRSLEVEVLLRFSTDLRSANALVQLEAHLTIARRALQKSACQLQRSLGSVVAEVGTGWCAGTAEECARTNQ